jgi:exosortase/archaeosortase family protein
VRMVVTDRHAPAKFALRFAVYSLALFGALRLGWIEQHLVGPFAATQGVLAAALFGPPTAPVITTLACSGADAIALFLGAVFAYPARWTTRFGGALAGLVLIILVNIIRIGTLGLAAASGWFEALHLYIWPALLTVVIGGYLFLWTRRVDAPTRTGHASGVATAWLPASPSARLFVALTVILMGVFLAVSPLYLDSQAVLNLATFMARTAAALLVTLGIPATATGNVLFTPHGALLVTQECITTPLIPVYVAAVTAFAHDWRWRALGYAATLPIFVALGIARLLVVALPNALVTSPLVLIHAFYQLALGAVIVIVWAIWRHGRHAAVVPAVSGLVFGGAAMWLLGAPYAQAIASIVRLPVDDPQSALAMLPGFQLGLYLALSGAAGATGWTRRMAGLGALVLTQLAFLFVLQSLNTAGIAPAVRDIRAWAVVGPLLIFLLTQSPTATPRGEPHAQPQP